MLPHRGGCYDKFDLASRHELDMGASVLVNCGQLNGLEKAVPFNIKFTPLPNCTLSFSI